MVQVTAPTIVPTDPQIEKIEPPALWTSGMWKTYISGAQEYNDRMFKAKLPRNTEFSTFHGVAALVRAGVVHITAGPEVMKWFDGRDIDDMPLRLLGTLVIKVGNVIEAEMNSPLVISSSASSASTPTAPATTAPEP